MSVNPLRFLSASTLVAMALLAPAQASAPAGRYMVTNGTVYDTKTKLTWQQTISTSTFSWSAADNYCFGLTSALPGTGWRLPTIKEIQTLVDYTVKNGPYIDQGAFPAPYGSSYWSATPLPNSSNAWLLTSDGTTATDVVPQVYNVRCVR
jgi:hypothetical protein